MKAGTKTLKKSKAHYIKNFNKIRDASPTKNGEDKKLAPTDALKGNSIIGGGAVLFAVGWFSQNAAEKFTLLLYNILKNRS